MVNCPTWIADCDFLFFQIYLFHLTLMFVLQWLSLHWKILIILLSQFIYFPSNSQRDALFHSIAYNYSCADWDGLRNHLRVIPQEDIFKLSPSAAASKFCEWVQVGINVYISHRKYHVKPHSFPWFSAACAAAIVYRNHFFHLYK